jgi:hypothetical protein
MVALAKAYQILIPGGWATILAFLIGMAGAVLGAALWLTRTRR